MREQLTYVMCVDDEIVPHEVKPEVGYKTPGLIPTTPLAPLTNRVRKLCASISDRPSVFLAFTNHGYSPKECHLNVRHWVKEHGGEALNGWIIWDCDSFSEAEFHCVWSHEGEFVDLTPRIDGEAIILFLPDPDTKMRRGPHGRIVQPCNRTTIPGNPYVFAGQPQSSPTVENAFHPSVHDTAAKLGLDVFCICD